MGTGWELRILAILRRMDLKKNTHISIVPQSSRKNKIRRNPWKKLRKITDSVAPLRDFSLNKWRFDVSRQIFCLLFTYIWTWTNHKFRADQKKQTPLTGRQGLKEHVCEISGSLKNRVRVLNVCAETCTRTRKNFMPLPCNDLVSIWDQLWTSNVTW